MNSKSVRFLRIIYYKLSHFTRKLKGNLDKLRNNPDIDENNYSKLKKEAQMVDVEIMIKK